MTGPEQMPDNDVIFGPPRHREQTGECTRCGEPWPCPFATARDRSQESTHSRPAEPTDAKWAIGSVAFRPRPGPEMQGRVVMADKADAGRSASRSEGTEMSGCCHDAVMFTPTPRKTVTAGWFAAVTRDGYAWGYWRSPRLTRWGAGWASRRKAWWLNRTEKP